MTVHSDGHRLAPDPAEDLVDRAEPVVEQEPPGGACDDRRDHGRQDQERDEHLTARHAIEEQQRHGHAEHQLDRQRDRGENGGMADRAPQPRVLEQPGVVEKPLNEVSSAIIVMCWKLTISV